MELILHTKVVKHSTIQETSMVKLIFKQHFLTWIQCKIFYYMFKFMFEKNGINFFWNTI